uniref:Uncharacterized protein n=1 Tax=mine drainage metagenome TaxID=410659 RepID=E6PM16_9ZZZZ
MPPHRPLNPFPPAPDSKTPGTERATYRRVILTERLRQAIRRLNPHIPAGAQDDALRQVLNQSIPRPAGRQPPVQPLAGGRCAGGSTAKTTRPVATACAWWTMPMCSATTGWRSTSSPCKAPGTPAGPTSCCSSTACRWWSSN